MHTHRRRQRGNSNGDPAFLEDDTDFTVCGEAIDGLDAIEMPGA